jgi:hypothetical protein
MGWRVYVGKHFGHYGNNSRNPEKPRARPFGCIQKKNLRTKEIEIACPKCDQIEIVRGKQKKREGEVLKANPDIAAIESEKDRERALREVCKADNVYASYSEWLKKHNCDRKWWMNVMTLNGTFEAFGISHTTMKDKLEPKLKEWREKKKIDVFHPQKGVWLRFTRTGTRPRVTDSVELFMETVERDGEIVEKVKFAPLDKVMIARAIKECPDLGKDVVQVLPVAKIQALIEAKGDLDKTDEIWDGPKNKPVRSTSSLESVADDVSDDDAGTSSAASSSLESAAEEPAAPTPASDVDAEEAALEAQMKALQAKKAAKAAAASKPAVKAEESADDFLAGFSAK